LTGNWKKKATAKKKIIKSGEKTHKKKKTADIEVGHK
jgi:hypothetical protein